MSEMTYTRQNRRRRRLSSLFAVACFLATVSCVGMLLLLLGAIVMQGAQHLSWAFLTSMPSRFPERAGILSGLVGSLWLVGLTGLFSVPIGLGAAIYLEEYATASRWRRFVQLNIANLAGVPSIVYGMLGLGLFVYKLALGTSVLAGALTMTLVVLPIVILSGQEALRAVPNSIRHASYALGATRWQTIWRQVLPAALPGAMTGVILAMSRALGEAAPLVAIGAAAFVAPPRSPADDFSALPLQIFDWAGRPQHEFYQVAAAAIIVLLGVLILMNLGAVLLRYKYGRGVRW